MNLQDAIEEIFKLRKQNEKLKREINKLKKERDMAVELWKKEHRKKLEECLHGRKTKV